MEKLFFRLLGTPEIAINGEALRFPTRKASALLFYLAVERKVASREKLMAVFWPESDSPRARAALRNTLLRVRSAFKAAGLNSEDYLVTEGETIELLKHYSLDLEIIESAYHAVQKENPQPELLVNATSMDYDDFLEGFFLSDASPFEEWASAQREYWFRALETIFEYFTSWLTEQGQPKTAIETALRWLKISPLSEKAYQTLIQAYSQTGNREAALRYYQDCREKLASELGISPSPELEALATRIKLNATANLATTTPPPKDGPLATFPELLVGRASEYQELVASYYRAARGHLEIVWLEGEAGMGKTRLASNFLTWAALQPADILTAQAFETGGHLPYHPLVEALRNRLKTETNWQALLGDANLVELSRLLGEVRERYPDLPAWTNSSEMEAQIRLFGAMAGIIEIFAKNKPVILFIDNLQWADSATLDWLLFAVRQWKDLPVMLLFTVRSEELTTSSSLQSWLTSVERSHPVRAFQLKPLTRSDVLSIVETLASNDTASESFGAWLYAESQGYPLYIIELLKMLVEEHLVMVERQSGKWRIGCPATEVELNKLKGLIPRNIRNLVLARLAQLSPPAFDLIAAMAVLGSNFDYSLICELAGLQELQALSLWDELLKNRLLLENPPENQGAAQAYTFTHDKFQEIVYQEIGSARRLVFHRKAFQLLQQHGASPATLAYHALAANLLPQALEASFEAGNQALRLYALGEAIRCYRQALQLLNTTSADKKTEYHTLYLSLGRAYELNNEIAQARSIYELLLEATREAGNKIIEGQVLNRLANVAVWQSNDLALATELLQQAISLAEQTEEKSQLAETACNLAQIYIYQFDDRAVAIGQQALRLAQELGSAELMARAFNTLALAEFNVDNWVGIIPYAREAIKLHKQLGNRALEAEGLSLYALGLSSTGKIEEAIKTASEAHRLTLEIQNMWGQAFSSFALAMALRDHAEYEPALTVAENGVKISQQLSFAGLIVMNLTSLGLCYFSVGRYEEALSALEKVSGLTQAPSMLDLIDKFYCLIYVELGHWQQALEFALKVPKLDQAEASYGLNRVTWHQTKALLWGNREQEALRIIQKLQED